MVYDGSGPQRSTRTPNTLKGAATTPYHSVEEHKSVQNSSWLIVEAENWKARVLAKDASVRSSAVELPLPASQLKGENRRRHEGGEKAGGEDERISGTP
jgi:hypothetical protein